MTGDLSLLSKLTNMSPLSVTFATGQASHATKYKTLQLRKNYSLHDVLFVPDFDCTFISVSKLLKQTGCIAIFTDTLYVLHDRFLRTMIRAGEEREGVYYFTRVKVARVNAASSSKHSSAVLWHRPLGHPSYKVLSTLLVLIVLNYILMILVSVKFFSVLNKHERCFLKVLIKLRHLFIFFIVMFGDHIVSFFPLVQTISSPL